MSIGVRGRSCVWSRATGMKKGKSTSAAYHPARQPHLRARGVLGD